MSSSPITIAIIGAGLIGPRHAQSVISSPETTLVAIVDPFPASRDVAMSLHTNHYINVADLLKSPHKPDAAIVCTPNHTHVSLSKELAAAGVHILVEKPISTDIPSGLDLVEFAENCGVKLLVGHHRRFNPYIVATKSVLEANSLGSVIAVSGLWTTYKPPSYFEPPTEWRQSATAGPVLINLVHDIDVMHHLLGPITRVHAEAIQKRRGFEADEGCAVLLRFASGVVGTFVLSDNAPSPYNFESGTGENPTMPKTGQDFYRIFGSKASLSVPDMTRWSFDGAKKMSWTEELSVQKIGVENAVPFDLQLADFVAVIRGEAEPSCSGRAGLQALVVCDAVKRAMENGGVVEIPESRI